MTSNEDDDDELERYGDLWGMARKEQDRFGSYLMNGTAATAVVIVAMLLLAWLMR